jgi:hypothetical protein
MSTPILDVNEPTGNGSDSRLSRLRARLVSVAVQLEVVADDGETLHPVETQAIRIPISDWSNWDLDVALAQIQEQLR